MKTSKALSLQIAGAVALATLFATSAFAESRHSSGTRSSSHASHSSSRGSSGHSFFGHAFSRRSSGGHIFSGRSSAGRSYADRNFSGRNSGSRSFGSRNSGSRNFGSRGSAPRSEGRVAPSRAWRGGSRGSIGRSAPYYGRGGYRNYNDGHRFYGQGRIDRYERYHGGYRVWLGGWGYPFFVPYRFWNPFRFRVGLFIGLNAFYDPFGYYSVYGGPGYYPPPVYSSGPYAYRDGADDGYTRLGGTVQSVDLQTGIVTIEDNASHRVYRALLPPRDNRVDDIRPGDYVELSGDWVRGREYDFDADSMNRFDARR